MVFRAHYDGRVLIPDEPVDLPTDRPLSVEVTDAKARGTEQGEDGDRPLMGLVRIVEETAVDDPEWPADGASQIDHYLYGLPKQPE